MRYKYRHLPLQRLRTINVQDAALWRNKMHSFKKRREIVAQMVRILFDRGYTDHRKLYDMIHVLYPDHGVQDFALRTMIHRMKT